MHSNLIAAAIVAGGVVAGMLWVLWQARREIRLERQISIELREQRALLRLSQGYAELHWAGRTTMRLAYPGHEPGGSGQHHQVGRG